MVVTWDSVMIFMNPVLTHATPPRAVAFGHEPHKGESSSRGGRRRAGCQRANARVSGRWGLHGKLGARVEGRGRAKNNQEQGRGCNACGVCVLEGQQSLVAGRKVDRILSIREAPLANNSTKKQREPPLLALLDKKKGAPPKQC